MRLPVSICGLHLDPIRRQCTMLLSKSGFLSLFLYSRPATQKPGYDLEPQVPSLAHTDSPEALWGQDSGEHKV